MKTGEWLQISWGGADYYTDADVLILREMTGGNFEQERSGPSIFVGICKSCGEVYEARSALEDLEGVTFKCKKILCEGRVALVPSGLGDDRPGELEFEPQDPPTRFN